MTDDLRIGSKRLMKDINRSLVIREVRENGPISRSELSRRTGLVPSTITKLCDELVAENLLFEFGEGRSTGGRRPMNLLFNNSYGYTIGIKIEDSSVVFSLANLKPTILTHSSAGFPIGATFDEVIPLIFKGIEELIAQIPRENSSQAQLFGIGIAVSGLVNPDTGVLRFSSLLGWKNIEFGSIIGSRFGTVVRVDNDVNCYALAQKWLGKGKDARNFVCITIGEGIGSGVIVDNQLYRGAAGGAGEIGHMIIVGGGRLCYCGQRGCLEAYASTKAILDEIAARTGTRNSIEGVLDRARSGDSDSLEVLSKAGQAIGWGLVNVVMQYNPEKIILGGEGIVERDFILPAIMVELERNWFNTRTSFPTVVEIDELGNENFLLGASILVLSDLLGQPIYNEKRTVLARQ